MNTRTAFRKIVPAVEKITKKEVDSALAAGNTHAQFKNRKINKRMLKIQEKVRRAQEIRENKVKKENRRFDELQQNQARAEASKKFLSFAEEVSALEATSAAAAPLGETFALNPAAAIQAGEYVDVLDTSIELLNNTAGEFDMSLLQNTKTPFLGYNHETGEFEFDENIGETVISDKPAVTEDGVLMNDQDESAPDTEFSLPA